MSRIPVPISVVDTAGNVLAGVSATVKNRASGSNVTLYNAETGGSTVGNPLTTDSQGRAFAYTDRQGLRIDYTGTGFTAYTEYREDAVPPMDIVSALPGSPFDGQEIYYQNATMATAGTVWHFRYRAGGGTYKWEYLGGGELNAVNTTSGTAASTTAVAFTNTPTITVPLAGDYFVQANGDWGTSNNALQSNVQIGNGTVFTNTVRHAFSASSTNNIFSAQGLLPGIAAASTISLYGFTNGGTATLTAHTKTITMRPIRVG